MAKILIIEDDPHLAEFMEERLSQAGHQCEKEASGERAILRMKGDPVDLMVLDVMLPGVSGFEICRRVRANPNWYTIPILFISAMNSQEEIEHGLAQGADDYMAKPFPIDALVGRVGNLLASNSNSRMVDGLTRLPGAANMKLVIQNLINCKKSFAAIYMELLGILDFGRLAGEELRGKAVRHFARVLHQCGPDVQSKRFRIAHMGGGHFVCVIEHELVDAYCACARETWTAYLPKFYESIGRANLMGDASAPPQMLHALFCSTKYTEGQAMSSRKLFEVLSRLRKKALEDGTEQGVFLDRRG